MAKRLGRIPVNLAFSVDRKASAGANIQRSRNQQYEGKSSIAGLNLK
jgi:hypothetical protein